MSGRLDGRKVVVLLAEGFEDLEFWVTVMRLREEGAAVTIAGLSTEPVRGKNGLEAKADVPVADVSSAGLDAVVVPGGWAPDKLRRYDAVTGLVRSGAALESAPSIRSRQPPVLNNAFGVSPLLASRSFSVVRHAAKRRSPLTRTAALTS